MRPKKLKSLFKGGQLESYPKDTVFYSLDFEKKLYLIDSGYVKRHSVNQEEMKVIESIYGPGYLFPLTPVYAKLLNLKLSKDHNTYIYQAMSDTKVRSITIDDLARTLKEAPEIYADLLYEAGRRLRANINRLASNALKDDYKKVALQLVYLSEEFGKSVRKGVKVSVEILAPLEAIDIAEQLNIPMETVESIFEKMKGQKLIKISDRKITLPDVDMLKAAYL